MSFGLIQPERLPYLKAAFNSGNPEDIFEKAKGRQAEKHMIIAPTNKKMENTKLEFVAKITMPDGRIIERSVNTDDAIPAPDDFDTSSKDGFLQSFDVLEKAVLGARNKIGEEITEAYLEEVSKKNA
jgi:hypothetical protein